MRKNKMTIIEPKEVWTPEGKHKGVLIIDNSTGEIAFFGGKREAREWLDGIKSKIELREMPETEFKDIKGGLVMPGMVDTHEHPFFYTIFEDAIDLSETSNLEEIIDIIKRESSRKGPIVLINWRTKLIPDLKRSNLDEASKEKPIIVIDSSFHGAVVNEKMGELIEKSIGPKEQLAGDFNRKTGKISEGYLIKAFEFLSPPVEIVKERVEKTFEEYFANGITAVHEMAISTWSQLIAFLELRKECDSFPVVKVYLLPHILERFIKSMKTLEQEGLFNDELIPSLGLKFLVDGSFGSRTARLSKKYIDADTRGVWATKIEEMNRVIALAQKNGIENIAFHAIGDEAIKRVVEIAQKWAKEAEKISGKKIDFDKWRIEHFELPIPEEVLKEVKSFGIWVSMQPNFLIDYMYRDRLGERIYLICPHRKVLGYEIPMMFGTDGMPIETLFAIWAATHAIEAHQRVAFEAALFAFSIMPHKHLGKEAGWLKPGEKADIVVFDPEDFNKIIIESEQPKNVKDFLSSSEHILSQIRSSLRVIHILKEGKEVLKKDSNNNFVK